MGAKSRLAALAVGQGRQRLGRILIEAGIVTARDVRDALELQKRAPCRLGSLLVRLGRCTHDQVRDALRRQLGMPVVDLRSYPILPEALELVRPDMIKRFEVLPLTANGDVLTVAMTNPFNLTAIDDLKFATGYRRVNVVCCTEEDFDRVVEERVATKSLLTEIVEDGALYQRAVTAVATPGHGDEQNAPDVAAELKAGGEQAPIITLCNYLLVEAVRRRASDIHVEPYETYFRVRMRIDGKLHPVLTPPQRLCTPMISRFKIRAGMDIADRRSAQDGHITVVLEGETLHFRVSTLPTVYGEKCVIRLLKKDGGLHSLANLGFSTRQLAVMRRAFRTPQGIILVTGPTGSGKTTTLHAALNDINDPDVNIVTLEDPVEASIAGVNHVDVGAGRNVTFAAGLRSILRQDPDVVFIGEMRDPEVCNVAIKAALTGHLVVSTLHTNGAAATLTRLADMGIPGYLLGDALLLVVAQRLVRRVCSRCVRPHTPTAEERERLELNARKLRGATLQQGAGCDKCMGSGYSGRAALYELLDVTPGIADMIRAGGDAREVAEAARHNGMRFLAEVGVEAVLRGLTTPEELIRVICTKR